MWAGYSQACDESGQEVDERSEKASRAGGGDGSAMEGLVPSHRGSLSYREITRTQSGFVMLDKRRET